MLRLWRLGIGGSRQPLVVFSMVTLIHTLLPSDLPGQPSITLKAILELPKDDCITFEDKTVIAECSGFLAHRANEKPDLVRRALLVRGRTYAHADQYARALTDAEGVLAIDPRDEEASLLRAAMLFKLKRNADAAMELANAVRLHAKSPRVHLLVGITRFVIERDPKGALQAFNEALSLDPKYAHAYYWRGMYYSRIDPERCFNDLNKCLELLPHGPEAQSAVVYHHRGESLLLLNRTSEALSSLLVARKLAPSSAAVARALARTYFELGHFSLVIHYVKELRRLDPDDPEGYALIARAQAKLGNLADAREAARRFEELHGKTPALYVALANVQFEIGLYKLALSYLDRALRVDPSDPSALVRKASLLASCPEAKYRDGKLALALALRAYEQNGTTRYNRWFSAIAVAEAYAETGRFDEAVRYAKEAIELAGPDSGKHGELREKLGLFERKVPYRVPVVK